MGGYYNFGQGGGTPGGSDKEVEYNNNGAFGGIDNGTSGQVLTSNGASSTPSFQNAAAGPSNAPAVSNEFITAYNSTTKAFSQAQPTDANLSVSDVTTNNVTTSAHGFAPKLPNDSTKFLNGVGAYAVPTAGAPADAQYIVGAYSSSLSAEVANSSLYNSPDIDPASPNALDDEFPGAAISGNWTQTNIGASVLAVGNSILTFTCPVSGADSVRQILKTAPATPWEFTTKMYANIGNSANYHFLGLCLADSSSGKITVFGPGYRPNVGQAEFSVINYTNATTFSAYAANYVGWGGTGTPNGPYWNRWLYLKINNDGTNLTFSASPTGSTGSYSQVLQVAKGSFITTIDRVGIALDTNDASVTTVAMFDWFRRTL